MGVACEAERGWLEHRDHGPPQIDRDRRPGRYLLTGSQAFKYFSDRGLLSHLLGLQSLAALMSHPAWGAVRENFAIAEVRKRLKASSRPPAIWFWRTAQGDEVDLLVEVAPERFIAVECKTAERVTPADLRGTHKLRDEYGTRSVTSARVVCRTAAPYPISAAFEAHALPLADLLNQLSSEPGRH